jgi:Homeodomain-like domain
MAFLLVQGYSYRAIAKDLGVARTTVDRMKRDMVQFNAYARTSPSPPVEPAPDNFNLGHVRLRWQEATSSRSMPASTTRVR